MKIAESDLPKDVGEYILYALIAEGAFAAVYEARHKHLGYTRALKIPNDWRIAQKFAKEARTVYELKHPRIVEVYSVNLDNDPPYIVMEFLPHNLRRVIDKGLPMPYNDASRIFYQILQGMEHAHSKGVIHRDLKPSNILLDNDMNAKIGDFGLAKVIDDTVGRSSKIKLSGNLKQSSSLEALGSFPYIAPEVVDGADHSPQSDVYSLGVIFAEMLGRAPLEYRRLLKVRPDIGAEAERIEEFLERALHKDPKCRYKSAGEMLDAFEKFLIEKCAGDTGDAGQKLEEHPLIEEVVNYMIDTVQKIKEVSLKESYELQKAISEWDKKYESDEAPGHVEKIKDVQGTERKGISALKKPKKRKAGLLIGGVAAATLFFGSYFAGYNPVLPLTYSLPRDHPIYRLLRIDRAIKPGEPDWPPAADRAKNEAAIFAYQDENHNNRLDTGEEVFTVIIPKSKSSQLMWTSEYLERPKMPQPGTCVRATDESRVIARTSMGSTLLFIEGGFAVGKIVYHWCVKENR